MDGYAVRFSDLEKPLKEIGTALAGKPFNGKVGDGECVRVMTGAVMPRVPTPSSSRRVVKKQGDRIVVPPGQKQAQNVRYAGEDLKIGIPVLEPGKMPPARGARPDRLARHRRGEGEAQAARRRSSPPATSSPRSARRSRKARSTTRTATPCTACSRASAWRSIDMGVVRDDPAKLEAAFRKASSRRCGHHHRRRLGRRSGLHQADDGQARRSAVLEDRDAAGTADGVRQDRQFLPVRPAGQSGGGDGHLLRTSCATRCCISPAGRTMRLSAPAGEVFRAAAQGSGTHRIPARHPVSRKAANGECASPASRARACCARCRRRTASSCSSTSAATSQAGESVQVQLVRRRWHEPDPPRARPLARAAANQDFAEVEEHAASRAAHAGLAAARAPRRRSEGLHAPHPLRRSRRTVS